MYNIIKYEDTTYSVQGTGTRHIVHTVCGSIVHLPCKAVNLHVTLCGSKGSSILLDMYFS